VTNTAGTVKGKVEHVGGIGDAAITYLTTSKKLSLATCLFAKNGTLVFLYVGAPHAHGLTQGATALARKAATRA
jgi:hypothetical protein